MEETIAGYNGKILRVNLSTGNINIDTIDELFCRKYLGGAGFVIYFVWKELPAGVDPLGHDNKMVFAAGPITGIALPGSGRNCVGAKSTLTGGIAKSEVGEFWGAELKRAGYDAIIIEGKADKPVYLWVHDGEAVIKDAGHLWGKNTKETQQIIRDELGDNLVRVAMIGPGGENLVRYACIMNGLHDASGRGGLGAVMGSKNLKAIAVRGRRAPKIANSESVARLRKWMADNMHRVREYHESGTGEGMAAWEVDGNLPVRNFRDGLFPDVNKIDAVAVKDRIRIGMDSCYGCTVRCKKVVQVEEPYKVDPDYGGPEYETLASLGSNCGINNLEAIAKGSELCNAYSIDTISTGATISFAMECFENGLLTTDDTGGIDLRFGNHEAMLQLVELITRREGIGALLAEGSLRAAREIGNGAEEYAMQVKGLEAGMHEPRSKQGLGLGYMVNPHGADHCCNLHDTLYVTPRQQNRFRTFGLTDTFDVDEIGPRKVAAFRLMQLERIFDDSALLCMFLPYRINQKVDLLAAVTGWTTSLMEVMKISERILTVARLFNLREGFTARDDMLPERFFQPKTDGILSEKCLNRADFEKARSYYYSLMGWDEENGIPKPERLVELGIE